MVCQVFPYSRPYEYTYSSGSIFYFNAIFWMEKAIIALKCLK